jgi:hypothetical protein
VSNLTHIGDRRGGRIPPPRLHFRCSYGLTVHLSKITASRPAHLSQPSIVFTFCAGCEFCIVDDILVSSRAKTGKIEKFFRPRFRPAWHAREALFAHSPGLSTRPALLTYYVRPHPQVRPP